MSYLIYVCFALALFFPLAYSRSYWSKYPPGKALMFYSWIVASVFGLRAWRLVTGDSPPEWVGFLVYASVATALLTMNVVLLREQRKDIDHSRRERREGIERLEERR